MAKPNYWIIKSEPSVYSFSQLQADGQTAWTGIRSFEARNNLRAMKPGDRALFYHSGEGKEIVGVARILSVAGPDPTAPEEDWASVDVAFLAALKVPVSLAQVKSNRELKQFPLVTRSRLSVGSVTPDDFRRILQLAKTRLPAK